MMVFQSDKWQCTKCIWRPGSVRTAGIAFSTPSDLLAGFRGTALGREREQRARRERGVGGKRRMRKGLPYIPCCCLSHENHAIEGIKCKHLAFYNNWDWVRIVLSLKILYIYFFCWKPHWHIFDYWSRTTCLFHRIMSRRHLVPPSVNCNNLAVLFTMLCISVSQVRMLR